MNNQKTAIETVKRISLNVKPNRIGIHGENVVILHTYLEPNRDSMQKSIADLSVLAFSTTKNSQTKPEPNSCISLKTNAFC